MRYMIAKQDLIRTRTPEDIERRYNLAELREMVERQQETISTILQTTQALELRITELENQIKTLNTVN